MNELHSVGVSGPSKEAIEAVDPRFIREGLLKARKKTWDALHQIRPLLVEGMTEDNARRLALKVFADLGVTKHWHKPYIRFGAGTALTFHSPLQPAYRLQPTDPIYIDLGPVWPDAELGLEYEGDVGDSFVLGRNAEAEKCAETARRIFDEAQRKWRAAGSSGVELYRFMRNRTEELGYRFMEEVDGHRLSDFPHHKYTKERLANIEFSPVTDLWILELQIADPALRFGAFYEDLLL